jgi:hypothetical protein
MLTFWTAGSTADAIGPTYLLVALIGTNFVLHGRFITGSPMRREVVLAASVIDIVIISLIVFTGWWGAGSGLASPFFVFYYPVLIGFSLVFPRSLTYGFAIAVLGTYTAIIAVTMPQLSLDHHFVEPLVARLVTLGVTAVLGNMYWRTQRQYRRSHLAAN